MRRTDPPAVVLPEGEGAALPSYADSDVGSSPRSLTAGHGSRPGSLTEEPPPVRWDDSSFAKVKLMCSYGGRILPRPHDNQLRYVGGDSRIAHVSRGITFSELTVKLSRMFGASVAIKYQLPNEELDALISVTSDEDLENMMEEYDRLQSVGNRPSAPPRLRLFLFPEKLERSQTSSLLEMMHDNQSRERWFVDILNGLPVLPHVRSETSSIVSETPDSLFQSNNMDSLEEWAAATSYGNSGTRPLTEEDAGNKQGKLVSATALFGSLLQQASLSEVASDPGSALPLKQMQFMADLSGSAPPSVISHSSGPETVSSGLPMPMQQHVGPARDGSMGEYSNKAHQGSDDGSVGVPEQRKHVDSEVLLTSDQGIFTSSAVAAGGEQFLPVVGLMDDDDPSQTPKGGLDEVCGSSQTVVVDVRTLAEPDKALKGEVVLGVPTLLGQPIFDEEVLPMRMLVQNLKNLQLEEALLSPVASPSVISPSSSAQFSPTVPAQQQPLPAAVMSKVAADDILKQQVLPVSPRSGSPMGTEDKLRQQNLPSAAPRVMDDTEVVSLRQQGSPSLAHFVPSTIPQQVTVFSNAVGEGMLAQQIPRTVEMPGKPQPPLPVISDPSPLGSSLLPPTLQEPGTRQKSPAVAPPDYYQQAQGFEIPKASIMQAPGGQLPINSQAPLGVVANPVPPMAAPLKPGANVGVATRQAAGTLRPQSPRTAVVGGGVNPVQHGLQARTPGTSSVAPPIVSLPANVSFGEAVMGLPPVATNMSSPSSVFTSMGEGVRVIPATSYAQGEAANVQRLANDPLPATHRVAAGSPKLGNQFNAVNFNAPTAPGIPTRFRAVGVPIQPVAEGVPLQQAPAVGVMADKNLTPGVQQQRAPTGPYMRAPVGPAGQHSYFMGDKASVSPHSAGIGGSSRYNPPPNITVGTVANPDALPFSGANPFVDKFQPVPTYPDVPEVAPTDQQQRRQARP